MKLQIHPVKIVAALAFTATVIGFSSFRQKPKDEPYSFRNQQPKDDDTTRKHNRDGAHWQYDKMNDAMKEIDTEMKKLDEQMKEFNAEKFEKIAEDAMRQVDFDKIEAEAQESMKKIDWEKMSDEMKEEVMAAQKINLEEVKRQMQKAKAEMERQKMHIKIDASKMNKQVKEAMLNAKRAMENAKLEIRNVKDFTDELAKDKLIDKSKAFKVEVRDGQLFIDGIKQSQEVSDKYKKYYRKSSFTITMSAGDDFWI